MRPGRAYPTLRRHKGSPTLPASYATMFLLAMVPPLWFHIMDRELERLNGGVRDRQTR
jgi:alkane 1-monooxygenase